MSFDLIRAVRKQGTRRRAIVLRPINSTQAQAHDLAVILIRVVREWQREVPDILLAYEASLQVRDSSLVDSANQIEHSIDRAQGKVHRVVLMLSPFIREWTLRMEKWHRTQFVGATKYATSVNLDTVIGPETARETMAAVVARNVSLISDISTSTGTKVSQIIWQGFTSRQPRTAMARLISGAMMIEKDRALRIASDQTTKLAAALDQERQREVGIDKFMWRHSGKVHFRPEHKARDGNIYAWDDNELDGDLPGVAINCGCKAQAYIDLGGSA